ncbi:hypothetical protein SLNSH_21185 [Alsobacter soli]|uniref:Secreted protein n=1 Tax=Alsobacter soli TaxID=2109933 RepID=A0A2T1HN47_9HYPH|nr:hypothetical protein [Alsobacter soli]PSC03021.1 hypothetical protein SLNSH_21185 [Alsobacter soli]
MKRFGFVLAVMAAASPALAQGRPQTPAMTCGQVHQIIAANGGIVLGTGGYTYDRYVVNATACLPGQAVKTQFVPTRSGACPVYVCFDPTFERFFDD